MIWYFQEQSESGSFACAGQDDEWFKSRNKDRAESHLDGWADDHDRVGADRKDACLHVYRSQKGDYPDFIVKFGPRGGVIWERC